MQAEDSHAASHQRSRCKLKTLMLQAIMLLLHSKTLMLHATMLLHTQHKLPACMNRHKGWLTAKPVDIPRLHIDNHHYHRHHTEPHCTTTTHPDLTFILSRSSAPSCRHTALSIVQIVLHAYALMLQPITAPDA
eukprot:jgi/Chrzof1/9282/UNPLg00249.t1